MNAMPVMPREAREWTIADLDLLPDDGLQYELLDGMLLVTPPPIPDHQRFVRGIFKVLDAACADERFEIFFAPVGWQPDDRTSLEPDALVVERAKVGREAIHGALLLAVEVLSPSTRRKDRVLKFSKYEEAGVESYWIVDPNGPTVTAYDLRDGRYVEVGSATGRQTLAVRRPFPVTLVPSKLR